MSNPRERKALRRIKKLVDKFERKCNRAEYTDTGEVWEVFEEIEAIAFIGLQLKRRRR